MLNAIAIDDEPIALEVIKSLAEHVVFIDVAECFTNSFKAMDYLQKNKVDLVFLDIKMPNISGIDFIKSIPNPPMVIFTTAYSEHAVQSFELDAIDYLLKPFSLPRFLKACNKAHEQYELRRQNPHAPAAGASVFIKSGYEQVRVNLDDVLYAESVGNYMQFVTAGSNVVSRLTMADAEALLPSTGFIRIHRSFIAAKRHVTKTDKRTVWIGKKELPVGEAYSGTLEKFINSNKRT
ncbi:LytTR family DNA-binding domain-containing protein [soil metagenome]|jgi:DNA-binding LytR/AlgR family response regulator